MALQETQGAVREICALPRMSGSGKSTGSPALPCVLRVFRGRRHDLVREPDAGNPHVRLCVQRRLACSAGDSPAGGTIRNPVAWIAGRRETEFLKPIDNVSFGETASHRAAMQMNAQVASRVRISEGRAYNRKAKAAWVAET